ncbi:MAG: DUF4124 domain-containing protein [Desulfobacterales bacterium]|nr:DUF4124 domain-containing protein [Desulfobacterales bacterium]
MRHPSLLLIYILILTFSAAAHAEFYKYINEKGEVIYTDDLSRIPAEKRGEVKIYSESFSNYNFEEEELDDFDGEDMQAMQSRLNEIHKELENNFNELNTEKDQLELIKDTLHSGTNKADIDDYNERMERLNTQIELYEQKRAAYEAETRKYNAQLGEINELEDNAEEDE